MIQKKKFSIPLYEQSLIVVVSNCQQELTDFTQKNDFEKTVISYSGISGTCFTNGMGHFFIALRSDISLSPGVIAHECKHCINALYVDLNISLDPINDEPECYLLTWMVDKVWEFYNKRKNVQGNNGYS